MKLRSFYRSQIAFSFDKYLLGSTLLVSIGAGLLIAGPVSAQTKIEQIVVTAQKRAQDIQAVPASISAFSGEGLEHRQIKTIEDLTKMTPNVSFTKASFGSIPNLSIRGVSLDTQTFAVDTPVALHIDGVYQPFAAGLTLVMSDLESVEVLRGPQGTLYGRNANAGVVNLITRKPTDVFEASGTIFGGSYERYGVRGYVSGPVTDKISLRLSGMVDRLKGFGKDLTTGETVDGSWASGGRLAVRLKPVETVTVDLSATRTLDHSSQPAYLVSQFGQSGPNIDAIAASPFSVKSTGAAHRTYENLPGETSMRMTAVSGIINWEITPDITLKSVTGWQKINYHRLFGLDATAAPHAMGDTYPNTRSFSQEFNLSTKLFDRVDLVTGLYYLKDQKNLAGNDVIFPRGVPFNVGSTFPFGFISRSQINQETKSKAVFLDVTVSLLDELRVLGGIRRTFDVKNAFQSVSSFTPPAIPAGACANLTLQERKYNATTYKGGVQYDFTPDIMGYVSYQTGFKDGGYNASVCNNAFLPESIRSWEVGVKSTLFNGTTTLNVSAFDYKYANMQVNRIIPIPGVSASIMDNAPAKIKGVEIEAASYLTEDLKADLGVGLLDAEFGVFSAGNASLTTAPIITNLTGYQLPRAPRMTVSAGLEYVTQLGDLGELTSRGEYSYSSRVWYSAFNEQIAKQDGYSVWNLIFTFVPASCTDLSFQAWVRNLTDKDYVTSATPSGTWRSSKGAWGDPRTFGASVTAKF